MWEFQFCEHDSTAGEPASCKHSKKKWSSWGTKSRCLFCLLVGPWAPPESALTPGLIHTVYAELILNLSELHFRLFPAELAAKRHPRLSMAEAWGSCTCVLRVSMSRERDRDRETSSQHVQKVHEVWEFESFLCAWMCVFAKQKPHSLMEIIRNLRFEQRSLSDLHVPFFFVVVFQP